MSRKADNCLPFFLCLALLSVVCSGRAVAFQGTGETEVYFSPDGGATAAIVREIDRASYKILVQAYSFTSKPIASALLRAQKRNVEVTVIMDGRELKEKYNAVRFFKNSRVQIFLDDKHAIAHNKVIIVDNKTLITGSFNFTKAAEFENAENLLVFKDNPPLVERYEKNFYEHLSHSRRY